MKLSELISQDSGARDYFSALPAFIQETMMQIGQDFQSEQELRQRAEHLMSKK